MSRRRAIVQEARAWIGTPYTHQASVRGAGADCLGLLRGVWREVIGDEPQPMPPYSPDWDEVAKRDVLWRAAARYMAEADEMRSGDVLLFRMKRGAVAKHLGICSVAGDAARFVHAFSGHGVIENSLSLPWRRRLVGVFAFPGTDQD